MNIRVHPCQDVGKILNIELQMSPHAAWNIFANMESDSIFANIRFFMGNSWKGQALSPQTRSFRENPWVYLI